MRYMKQALNTNVNLLEFQNQQELEKCIISNQCQAVMTRKQSVLEFNRTLQKVVPKLFQMPLYALQKHPNLFFDVLIDLLTWLFGILCPILAVLTFISAIQSKKLSFEVFQMWFRNPFMLGIISLFIIFAFGYLILLVSFDLINQRPLTHFKDLLYYSEVCADQSLYDQISQVMFVNSDQIKFSLKPKEDCMQSNLVTLLPYWEKALINNLADSYKVSLLDVPIPYSIIYVNPQYKLNLVDEKKLLSEITGTSQTLQLKSKSDLSYLSIVHYIGYAIFGILLISALLYHKFSGNQELNQSTVQSVEQQQLSIKLDELNFDQEMHLSRSSYNRRPENFINNKLDMTQSNQSQNHQQQYMCTDDLEEAISSVEVNQEDDGEYRGLSLIDDIGNIVQGEIKGQVKKADAQQQEAPESEQEDK